MFSPPFYRNKKNGADRNLFRPTHNNTTIRKKQEGETIKIEPSYRTMMVRLDGAPRRVMVIKRSWLQEEEPKEGSGNPFM